MPAFLLSFKCAYWAVVFYGIITGGPDFRVYLVGLFFTAALLAWPICAACWYTDPRRRRPPPPVSPGAGQGGPPARGAG